MRGLYTCGILDTFMEKGIDFDGAVGISAGACFGCNLKSRQPGRALRYIGLQIVRSYVNGHKDVKLEYLLSPAFYNNANTLRDAAYTPAKSSAASSSTQTAPSSGAAITFSTYFE